MTVQRSQASIERGQTATYVVQVSTQNGSASEVWVALTAQPSSQKPVFSSGCAHGNGNTSCSISSVTTTQPASLTAQIAVAANATAVSSVTLIATASVTSTGWNPPAAAETTAVTAASASTKTSASASPSATHLAVLPLGPIPVLNSESSMLIGPGNAAALFPTIGLSPTVSPGPTPATQPGKRDTAPTADASPVSLGTPVFTAQVSGLTALGLAIMLTVVRLSARKRRGKPRT